MGLLTGVFADLKAGWDKSLGLRYFFFFMLGFLLCAVLVALGEALGR